MLQILWTVYDSSVHHFWLSDNWMLIILLLDTISQFANDLVYI